MSISAVFFDAFMYPLEKMGLRELRSKIIPGASGNVLELGAGTGVNLKHYVSQKIDSLTVSDLRLNTIIHRRAEHALYPVNAIEADVQDLPFPDDSFDSVVFTLLFCSVPEPEKGLREVFRILKPGGKLFCIEHVLTDSPGLAGAQHWLTPAWKKIAGGCHLNRDTECLIKEAGFEPELELEKARGVLFGAVMKKT